MFFILSKILGFLFSPVTWVFVLLLWGLLTRRPVRRRNLLIAGFATFCLFSNSFIFSEVMRAWEPRPVNPEKNYEYAVVLGGMTAYNGEAGRPAFFRNSDRFLQVLPLYKKGQVKKILISGGSGRLIFEEKKESDLLKDYLVSVGFPAEDILVENESRNTRENAVYSGLALERAGADTSLPVLLVTSAYHMPRSAAAFEKAGIPADPFPVDHYSSANRRFHPDHLLLPNSEVLMNWDILLHEWVGWISYKVVGYI